MDETLDEWFLREILAHEAALDRYLRRHWPDGAEVSDLRQEAYVRVYEAAAKVRPASPKSFLFTTARHLMVDRARRGRVVSIDVVADLEALNVPGNEVGPEQAASARQELRRLAQAFDRLPPKCREVVWMRKVEGLSQREVAGRLEITQGAVEKHVMKGIRLLADRMFGAAPLQRPQNGVADSEDENELGQQRSE